MSANPTPPSVDQTSAAGPSTSQPDAAGESGYSTAELLGNAALAIGALGVIWLALGETGSQVVSWIGEQLTAGG